MAHTHHHDHDHSHEHAHHHKHDHAHEGAHHECHHHHHSHTPPKNFQMAFIVGIILNLAFVVTEAVFGFLSHSLALLADAGHNLSDVLGLTLAWGAAILSRRIPSSRHTYGLRRSSIFAALINAIVLLIAIGGIAWEAIQRLSQPQPVDSVTMIWVASIGILVNGFTAYLFAAGNKEDLNIRGAYLHMLADAAVSVGVVISAIAISYGNWYFLDPVVSLIVIIVITWGTWGLLSESLHLAFDAVPSKINPTEVSTYLKSLPGVVAVHDLHIWAMSTTETALTVHLIKPDATIDDGLLEVIKDNLLQRFSISHTTIQFEIGDAKHPCSQAPDEVV